MQIKFSELKKKDVLNVESGKNLGKIVDLIIEESSGKIQKIITNGKKMCLLPCDGEEIDYSKITKIGDDVILVCKRSENCKPNFKSERLDDCEPKRPPRSDSNLDCACFDFDEE